MTFITRSTPVKHRTTLMIQLSCLPLQISKCHSKTWSMIWLPLRTGLMQIGRSAAGVAGTIEFGNGSGGTAWTGQQVRAAGYDFFITSDC